MKIIALEREKPNLSSVDFQPYLRSEAASAWALDQAGVVRELYFRADQHTAVLVLECGDIDEARQTLDSLPLVQAGLIEFELIPLVPYDGFARLFELNDLPE